MQHDHRRKIRGVGNAQIIVTENYILSLEKVKAVLKKLIIIIIIIIIIITTYLFPRHPRHASRCPDSLRLSPVCAGTPGG
jgi:hypothetical protein